MKRQQLFDALVGVDWEGETRGPFKRFIKSLSAEERAQLHESNCAYVTVLEANIESYDDEINGFSHVYDHREGGLATPEYYQVVGEVHDAFLALTEALEKLDGVKDENHSVSMLRSLARITGIKVDPANKEQVKAAMNVVVEMQI